MHNLAIALKINGFKVTGSDDEIFEPSKTRLQQHGFLPQTEGWNADLITPDLDAVILGMHARQDNPELLKAKSLGLKIFSYPEYIYQQSVDKQRIVIAGSHGKTSITSMILHILNHTNKDFDYLVGAQLEGFDNMVKLSNAPIIVIEGDEYLSSPDDRRPKFIHYQHHIGLISGIAWDHINVFPTFEEYKKQFETFVNLTPKGGKLIYCEDDVEVKNVCTSNTNPDVTQTPYTTHKHLIKNSKTYLIDKKGDEHEIQVFGEHNLKNINAAYHVCKSLGVTNEQFYNAISSFKGASNRLEKLAANNGRTIFKDFAHAPSKLKATTQAVKTQFRDQQLLACLELHTFSSLNKDFLTQYQDTFNQPDVAIVYYNPATLAHKKLAPISVEDVKSAFNNPNLIVINDTKVLQEFLLKPEWTNHNILLMSSGNFGGINLKEFAQKLTNV
jgi:UDP-N-acetylmuramate: L-alanyl-gamma-D-glutamyl-meso-diaminopimelate ligase